MRINYARSGMILASDVVDSNGNLLLEKGILLTEKYLARLRQHQITDISIQHPALENAKPSPVISDDLRLELTLCFQALYTIKTEGMQTSKLQQMYFRQLYNASDSIITEVGQNMPNILNTEIRKPTTDEVTHAVNVCLLSVVTGHYLKLPRPALRELALGALLHDVGKSVIPYVDNKPVNSPSMHPHYGRDLLLKHKLSSAAARIAAEHHEYYNGSGYPLGIEGKATHPLSRIVSLANYFDNAVAEANAVGRPLHDIIENLLASSDILFDHNTLRAFIHTTPIYTLGSMVILSTGQTGYIIRNRAHCPLRPIVRLYNKTGWDDLDMVCQPDITIIDIIEEYPESELVS
ncbi:MAG: HD-GYP domain-containing protein [Negativicutes bacterium]